MGTRLPGSQSRIGGPCASATFAGGRLATRVTSAAFDVTAGLRGCVGYQWGWIVRARACPAPTPGVRCRRTKRIP